MRKLYSLALALTLMYCPVSAAESQVHDIAPAGRTIITKATGIDGKSTFGLTQKESPKAMSQSRAAADAQKYEVKVIIDPDANGGNKTPQGVWLIKDSYISYQSMRKATNKFNVPAGDYLIQVIFTNNDDAGAILFFPDIKVDGNKEIHVNASMADKKISTAFTLPDGEKAVLPESNGMGGATDAPYNVKTITADIHLTYDGISKGSLQSLIGMGGDKYSELLNISTNVNDARGEVSYVVKAEGKGKTGAKYFYFGATTMDKVEGSVILENDPKYFHKVSTSDIARTPAYDKFGNNNDDFGMNFHVYNSEASFVGGLSTEVGSDTELYICTPPADFSALHPMSQTYTIDYSDEDEWVFDGISSPFFTYTDKGLEYYAMQDGNTYKSDKAGWETLPFNPALTFDGNDGIKFGDNFAVCVTAVQYDDWADVPFSYMAPECYYGNYGENRSVDLDVAGVAVKYNGVLQEFEAGQSLYDWAEKWAANGHEPGKMTYIFTNENIAVDGMTGSNVCEVSYTEGAEDATPPTLQRVMMRDAAGNVTNRFDSPKGATVNIVGGDFIRKKESIDTGAWPMSFTFYTFADAECTAEYAPHGSADFQPFEVVADPAKFFMPGFGLYLSGSLEQVSAKSENGWYDLRISLTDQAGNTQVQTISPAFRIGGSSGIGSIVDSPKGFAVNNRSISCEDGSDVTVYNLTGAEVPNSNLANGLYIAKSATRTAKIIVK